MLEELGRELASLRKPKRGENHSKRTCLLLSTPRFARYLRQTRRGALKIDRAAVHAEDLVAPERPLPEPSDASAEFEHRVLHFSGAAASTRGM